MELKMGQYVLVLFTISFAFFYVSVGMILDGTNEAYRDFLLTIAVVHFVMSKLITIHQHKGI
ncbi:hypothetical protein [Bacillus suaedae]|uniref:Uncharacterized protein n=1 Tax=Halalkalibacter suaedae TaxID=2822140 RepID=A0A941ASX9_9BACI|nr:hypothetical protein [Bacillus suaedae]MBP3950249.1 hypothetical protein [Bacillus suaedae]